MRIDLRGWLTLALCGLAVPGAQAAPRRSRTLFIPAAFDAAAFARERGAWPRPEGSAGPAETALPPRDAPRVGVLRTRYVRIDPSARRELTAGASEPRLNLFDDVTLVVTRDRLETVVPVPARILPAPGFPGSATTTPIPGAAVWVGKVKGEPLSTVIVYFQDDGAVAASIASAAGNYSLRYAGGGVHRVEQIDPGAFVLGPDTLDPEPLDSPPSERGPLGASAGGAATQSIPDNGGTIDMFVPYTDQARYNMGGTSAMLSRIGLAISQTNNAFAQSVADVPRVRLVATAEVGRYAASPDHARDLQWLATPGDGYWNAVDGWREAFGADIVSLIVDSQDAFGSGVSYRWLNHSAGPQNAFNVVAYDAAAAPGLYTFAHELGHTMGSNHDRLEARTNCPSGYCGFGAFDYSFGRVVTYTGSGAESCNFRTIMAYPTNCPGTCPAILAYSTPSLAYSRDTSLCPYGTIGISNVYSNSAWNAASIYNTRYTVSNFRPSVAKADLVSPGPGSALTAAWTTFAWTSGYNASSYWFLVGSSPGVFDLANVTVGAGTQSATVYMPTDGRTLYVRLWSIFNNSGYGQYTDYTYTAATPALSIEDTGVVEGSTTAFASFRIKLNLAPAQGVTVTWGTADGTATQGADYTGMTESVGFGAGEMVKVVSVPVHGDVTPEPNKTFFVNLSNAGGATIADSQAQATIIDDDTPITEPATVYRLRHPDIGAYLFTVYPWERDSAQIQYGYIYEGPCCKWLISPAGDGRSPMYRLFSSTAGEYFFTISAQERDGAVGQFGYVYEGVAAYCHPGPAPAAPYPWYRLRRGNKHLYTITASERDAAVAQYGFTYEGVSCYLPPP